MQETAKLIGHLAFPRNTYCDPAVKPGRITKFNEKSTKFDEKSTKFDDEVIKFCSAEIGNSANTPLFCRLQHPRIFLKAKITSNKLPRDLNSDIFYDLAVLG